MKLGPVSVAELSIRLLKAMEADERLAQLNGVEMIMVLNSASGTVGATVTGQAMGAAIKEALKPPS